MTKRTRTDVWLGVALMAVIACPTRSQAQTLSLSFSGTDVSGALTLLIEPDGNTGVLPSTPPNSVDPIGAYTITQVSGTFSDKTLGITNAVVTKLVGLNPVAPEPTNAFAPVSFSLLPVAHGVPAPGGAVSPGLHYDNLYYPGGSPQTASDYPFKGGFFDIYGLAFLLNNGDAVNLWSNGAQPVVGLNYGVAVTDGTDLLDYKGGLSVSAVPLPGAAPMFGAALLALGALGYGVKRKKAAMAV